MANGNPMSGAKLLVALILTTLSLLALVAYSLRWLWVAILALALLIKAVQAEEKYHSRPDLLSWIPATCCVTNDCCWEISANELEPLGNDEYRVRATGQVRKRTGYSPDGKYYRCACDYDGINKNWVKHQGANTRCLFIPQSLF